MRRLLYLAVLTLGALVVLAPVAWAQDQEVTVGMDDNFFEPANITVEPGTTVTWVQNGSNPHTTTSYDGLWDSGMIEGGSGGSFSFTFDEPGTYDYFCIPHEAQGMVGSVTVAGGAAADDAARQETMPDTGGPALVSPVALTLLISGIAGLVFLRRHRLS
ncbi:MAG TPA: plastocyanin/azurin family copper-binding protein [Rubrobacteraceae bacterium]|nr:plastocyanin/azurin family copper-binding protein [Rubrobacteraceae bacterium]